MGQLKRIKLLSAVFLLMALVTVLVYALPALIRKNNAFPDIALKEGLAGLDELEYTYKGISHELKPSKTGEEWYIDKAYPVKDQFLALIQTGFSRLKIKRVLSKEFKQQADSLFKSDAIHIRWKMEDATGTFSVVTNPNDVNSSYYRSAELGDETYVAVVPGFTGDISNIFELPPMEWRKKTLLTGSSRTIQSIALNYKGKPAESFILNFINGDYQVMGVEQLDSTRLYTYISQYEQVSVDKYLSEEEADSVKRIHSPDLMVQLDIRLLTAESSRNLELYRLVKDPSMVLVYIRPNQEWALMKTQRVFPLLVKRTYFVKK